MSNHITHGYGRWHRTLQDEFKNYVPDTLTPLQVKEKAWALFQYINMLERLITSHIGAEEAWSEECNDILLSLRELQSKLYDIDPNLAEEFEESYYTGIRNGFRKRWRNIKRLFRVGGKIRNDFRYDENERIKAALREQEEKLDTP